MRPSVNGVVETSLYVVDLRRSTSFYEDILGFPEILREEGRLHALGVAEKQVLLLFAVGRSTHPTDTPGGPIPPHDGRGQLHVAFSIAASDVQAWRDHLSAKGITIESEVDCPGCGHSIYFHDPDGHAVDLITPGCWKVY
jgi:catechol 2,3-dioxygenase-like lactoylglutathione lyase family enzyme